MHLHRFGLGMAMMTLCVGCRPGAEGGTGFADGGDDGGEPPMGTTSAPPGGSQTSMADTAGEGSTGCAPFCGQDMPSFPTYECEVPPDELDAVPCDWEPPPVDDAFSPEPMWEWAGASGETMSIVIPLVANLTDDNDDGEINLCDTPDVVVVASPDVLAGLGHIYVLDGATGTEHFRIETEVDSGMTPAIGDIDGDGLPEIVTITTEPRDLVAFEHDGNVAWASQIDFPHDNMPLALAIADLDNDGTPEIFTDNVVVDHTGQVEFTTNGDWSPAPTAADLDGDQDLEIVYGTSAYHHDGTPVYVGALGFQGFPQVADLDADGDPEIIHTSIGGLSILDANGTHLVVGATPTGDGSTTWLRPVAVHDLAGDDAVEFSMSSANHYSAFQYDPVLVDVTMLWSADVADQSGIAAGTAFDFLGDGVAEAMYADETTFFIFDGETGAELLTGTRASRTLIEYPVVADIDNDDAAELLVVSNEFITPMPMVPLSPTLQAIKNTNNAWVPARRIWNQHTYHVTNVREDGTIPQFEPPHWESFNTFRTQAQIVGGAACDPEG